ncbi:transmembrane protein 127-like [Patiria miniata]|uniref:Transmembrane protein 127 transmembrane region domain-containing protein n=1 Tax=Patiria miniata TaxID=46514 RepID=A0A913Z527_PATMI|nr:transmembrane protein 127-like [Patiria miniata]
MDDSAAVVMQSTDTTAPDADSTAAENASENQSTNADTTNTDTTNNDTTNTTNTNGSSSSSGRSSSRSSRRHRSRGHHRHRSRRRRHNPKRNERNLVAAILGMVVIAVLISSLAEQKWFHLHGGECAKENIGAYQFLTPGIETSGAYRYCFNTQVVAIMRAVIAFIFLSITSSLFAFFLDTLGPMKSSLKLLRRHAAGNIITVLLCLTMSGFCYWSASLMESEMDGHKLGPSSKVLVSFGVGYYLIVASGALSVIIAATNLLRPYSSYDETPRERLIEDWDQLLEAELANMPSGPLMNPANMPEPPAYTP